MRASYMHQPYEEEKGCVSAFPPQSAFGIIVEVRVHARSGSTLVVSRPKHGGYEIDLDDTPDNSAAELEIPVGSSPLALRFELQQLDARAATASCTCLVSTRRGPRRVPISVAAGLALATRGRHSIVAPLAESSTVTVDDL